MAAEDRDLQAGVHGDIHALLGELCDAEREAIWPRMGADERAEFDHEHLDWLRAELRRLDARIAFLHESAPEMPSPQLKAAMASAAEDWGDFVADCSRAEEKALGLDVRLRARQNASSLGVIGSSYTAWYMACRPPLSCALPSSRLVLDGLVPADAYRASRDASRMANASIHSNAKHILRRARAEARIEELRRQTAAWESRP